MKIVVHLFVQLALLLFLWVALGLQPALFIVLFHFIPSIDYFFKKTGIAPSLHRGAFHNLFIVLLAAAISFGITNSFVATLATLNLLLHITMDLRGGGVMLFFPISKKRTGIHA